MGAILAHDARGGASSSQCRSSSRPRASSPGRRWCAAAAAPPQGSSRRPQAHRSVTPSPFQCRESLRRASPLASHSGLPDRSPSRSARPRSHPSTDQPQRCAPPRRRRTPREGSSPRQQAVPQWCPLGHGTWRDRAWRRCAGTEGQPGGAGSHRGGTSPPFARARSLRRSPPVRQDRRCSSLRRR